VLTAAQALQSVDARLLGSVLNMTKLSKTDAHQYLAYRVELPVRIPVETVRSERDTADDEALDAASPTQDMSNARR
jgi:hypothetical protein